MTKSTIRTYLFLMVVFLLGGCASTQTKKAGQVELMEQARYYYEKALYSEAERIYLELEKTMPVNYDINFRLGNIYVRTGQFPAAETRYLKCIEIDSSEPKCWYNLSLLKVKEALAVAQEGRYKSEQTDQAYSERFLALQEGLIKSITGK